MKIGMMLALLSSFSAFAKDVCRMKASERVDDVQRIFIVDERKFNIMVPTGKDVFEIREVSAWANDYVSIIEDLAPDQSMYVVIRVCNKGTPLSSDYNELDLHIHHPSDVEGGGWRRDGKSPTHGENQVVE